MVLEGYQYMYIIPTVHCSRIIYYYLVPRCYCHGYVRLTQGSQLSLLHIVGLAGSQLSLLHIVGLAGSQLSLLHIVGLAGSQSDACIADQDGSPKRVSFSHAWHHARDAMGLAPFKLLRLRLNRV